ncbi:hypothetical protein DRO54_00655 [Candidatus Bathyarchaeota archaeon]|nr:MAG: hypothetical protein DRO54_00655 [Candidatus Bathyarchaeota archaeon]
MASRRTRRLALIEGITAGILFGTASIFIRFLGEVDTFSIAFWRLIIASAMLTIILITLRKPYKIGAALKNFKELIVLSVFLGLHFIFFVSAVKDTTILNATVFVNTTPIFSLLISSFIFKVGPSRLAVLGLTVSFIGACIIAYAETSSAGFSLYLKGDLEAVLAALVEAFYLNFGRKTRSKMPLLSAMLPISLLAAMIVGFISIPTGHTLMVPLEIEVIVPLLCLGLLPTAMAHTLYFSSLSNLKSFETATMALLEPIGATILAAFIFQEVPVGIFVFGASLVLLGILFVAIQEG